MTKSAARGATVYALQLETSTGAVQRANLLPVKEPKDCEQLRQAGRNICIQNGCKSWAIIAITPGRARIKVIETGDQYNDDTWNLDELNGY